MIRRSLIDFTKVANHKVVIQKLSQSDTLRKDMPIQMRKDIDNVE